MPDYKHNPNIVEASDTSEVFVTWSDSLNTGVTMIDEQHRHLIDLTNELFQACKLGGDTLDSVFRTTMKQMVDYVRFHFSYEQDMLLRIKYPKLKEQKSEHKKLVKTVLEATKEYGDKSKRFVPNNFVRFLRDWIIGHIGHHDKMYANYIVEQLRNGRISEKDITG